MSEQRDEGWARPLNSRKFHFFRGARSLCNNWLFLGAVGEGSEIVREEPNGDDCKVCHRKRLAEITAEASHE